MNQESWNIENWSSSQWWHKAQLNDILDYFPLTEQKLKGFNFNKHESHTYNQEGSQSDVFQANWL